MATRPKAVIESHNGEEFSPITIAKNVLTDDGQNLHDILSDRKEDMMTPTIENSSSMFKVGQGDNVDYSSNVVNGAYESMVLKGKTMVNYIQEPSSKDVVLPYEFADGQYVTINDTKESGALGIELKGQTLVNLCKLSEMNKPNSSREDVVDIPLHHLKENTQYTVIVNVLESSDTAITVGFLDPTGGSWKGVVRNVSISSDMKMLITTGTGLGNKLRVHNNTSTGTLTVKNAIVLEGNYTNQDIPFFEGMSSCKMPILKSVNQLFDYSLITAPGGSLSFTNDGRKIRVDFNTRRDCYQNVDLTIPSGTYNVSFEVRGKMSSVSNMNTIHSSKLGLAFVGNSNDGWSAGNTPKIDAQYVNLSQSEFTTVTKSFTFDESKKVTIYYHGWNDNPVGWCEFRNIRIVPQGKSSTLSLPEEVVLRSLPNGMCDTFNTRTGVYTQRVGEVFLNGSERWAHNPAATDKTLGLSGFNLSVTATPDRKWYGSTLCDKMLVITSLDKVGVYNGQGLNILIKSDSTNVNTLKEILAKDPITVQYQLENPIITKITLPSTLKSWNKITHVYSEIPENSLYPTLSHSNPTYPVILKPSTKYSIVANSYSNSHTSSAINFNLGGATASTTVGNRVTTITTPSTLSNELLTMSGRGNKLKNVMVIEGDVVGDEPYFEGMCDSKSPILSNVMKNLVNVDNYVNYPNENLPIIKDGEHSYIIENKKVGNWQNRVVDKVKLKANTTYTLSYDYELLSASVPMNYGVVINLRDDSDTSTNISGDASAGKPRTFTPTRDTLARLCMYATDTSEGMNRIKFSNIQLEESSNRTGYEPYKSNILSVVNKNIFDGEWEDGSYGSNGIETNYATSRNKNKHIKVEPSCTIITTYPCVIHEYDVNKQFIQFTYDVQKLTLSDRTQYINFRTLNNKTCNSVEYQNFSIQVVDKTIVLRSLPNGVCDTLNVETGEYVQRIEEIVLDNSDSTHVWNLNSDWSMGDVAVFWSSNIVKMTGNSILCDKFPSLHRNELIINNVAAKEAIRYGVTSIQIFIAKNKLVTPDVAGFKQWLSQNPIVVQYELETPIVSTIDIQGFPYAYTNGHVILSSGSIEQSLTPKVEYSVVTNRNGQIRSNQKMVERHQKQLDRLQAMILTNLVNTQYEQTLTNLKYDLKNVREEVK